MWIYKDGGCSSVTCGKCRLQFCWDCLTPFPSYTHSDPIGSKLCPQRTIYMFLLIYFGVIGLGIKLLSVFPFFKLLFLGFCAIICYIVGVYFYFMFTFVHFALYDSFKR